MGRSGIAGRWRVQPCSMPADKDVRADCRRFAAIAIESQQYLGRPVLEAVARNSILRSQFPRQVLFANEAVAPRVAPMPITLSRQRADLQHSRLRSLQLHSFERIGGSRLAKASSQYQRSHFTNLGRDARPQCAGIAEISRVNSHPPFVSWCLQW